MKNTGSFICLLAIAGMGCGSSVSQRAVVDARASTQAAEEVGADQTPRAAFHLELANEELEKASKLANDGEGEAAERMFARARVDAELAIALSQEAQTVSAAEQTQQRIEAARATFVQGGAQ